jgi:hypothetical protein
MKFRLFITFILIVIASNLNSQNNRIRVFGYVTDIEKQAVRFTNVVQKGTTNGTTTSETGYYELFLNPKDSMIIKYSFLGYESVLRTVSSNEKVVQIDVTLNPVAKELANVEVRQIRKQTSSSESLDAKNFRLMPNTAGGIEGILSTIAGVNSSNELSSQYSVRGGSYDENMVYVNDIEVYRPLLISSAQQEGLSFVNPDMVQEVSFSAGGFDAKYGDKMSSVLDIRYKKPTDFEASASVSLLGASVYVGTKNKNFTQIHGIRYKTSQYLLGTLDTQGQYNPTFFDYQTFLTYEFSPKWEMTFLGNFSRNEYQFTPTDRTTTFGTMTDAQSFTVYFDGQEKDLFITVFGALTLNYRPQKNIKLSLITSAYNTNEQVNYDIMGQYWLSQLGANGETTNTLGVGTYLDHARDNLQASVFNVSHQGEWDLNQNQIKWGVCLQRELIADQTNEWGVIDSAGYSMPYNGKNVVLASNLSGDINLDSYRLTEFFQDTYKNHFDAGTFFATAGIRGNYWSYNKELLISPRVSVGFIPNWEKEYTFRFATGVYDQAPFYKELRDTVTDANGNHLVKINQDIKAQRTVHFVLGADHYFRYFGRPFKFTTEAYFKWASRLTPYEVDNVNVTYLSNLVATGYTAGIDFKLFGEMLPGTDSWVGFSLMDSKENIEGDYYYTYDTNGNVTGKVYPGYIPTPNEQRYSFTMFFQDYFPNNPKYKVHLKMVWADGLPFGPPNSQPYLATYLRTPPYRRVDIGVSRLLASGQDKIMTKPVFKYAKDIWLTLEVFNLLNIQNVSSYYWVTGTNNQQYAVPNYLTLRQLNLKLVVDF